MVGDRADAMLEVMDEEGIVGSRLSPVGANGGIGLTRRRRGSLRKAQSPDVNISAIARRWGVNRGLLNVWRREAGLISQRSAKACAQEAMFVPVTVVGDRTSPESSPSDVARFAAGRIEIEIAGARMTVIGSVAPELAQAMVTALRGRR